MRIKTLFFILILTAFLLPMAVFAATVPVNWETYNLYGVTQSNMMIKTSGCTVGTDTTGIFDTAASLETNETSGTLTFSSGEVCTVEGVYTKSTLPAGLYYPKVSRDTVDWYTADNLGIRTSYCSVNASETDALLSLYSSGFGDLAFDTISCNVNGVYSPTFTAANDVVPTAPEAPSIQVSVNGTTATISWSSIENATGYIFYFAPKIAEGVIGEVGSLDMGSLTGGDAKNLPLGSSFYIAVQAYNAIGTSGLSNVPDFTITSE